MLLWVAIFPKNYYPQKIAFKSYEHAAKAFMAINLKPTKKNLKLLYLEENPDRIPFT